MMRVLVIGKGVVGDATGHALALRGHDALYRDPPKGIEGCVAAVDCALLCVPTPRGALGYNSRSAVYKTGDWLQQQGYRGLVGVRSTVIMGTCDELQAEFPEMAWFSWPEFLQQSRAREMAADPPYRVVGYSGWDESANAETASRIRQLTGLRDDDPGSRRVTPLEAEFIKYATNALLAGTVGLCNELGDLATAYGLDWNALVPPVAERDAVLPANVRIIPPGGFGGACLPKDLAALLFHSLRDKGLDLPVLSLVERENTKRRGGSTAGERPGTASERLGHG